MFLFFSGLTSTVLFPVFSIKEMELFARWSAKVWALWIVIIQLAAEAMRISLSDALGRLPLAGCTTVMAMREDEGCESYGLCECLFLHSQHIKSHTTTLNRSMAYCVEKNCYVFTVIWAGQPELLTLYFSHLPYPISVTVHCLYHITWTLLMSFWIVNSFALCHVLGWTLFVRRLFPSHIFKYSFLLETFLPLSLSFSLSLALSVRRSFTVL